MKNIGMFLLNLSCLSYGVQAQNSTKLHFFAGSGTVIPVSSYYYDNFSGTPDPGLNMSAGLGYAFSPSFTFMAEFDYSRFNYAENSFSNFRREGETGIFENSNLKTALGFIGSLRISPFPNRKIAVPYLKIGTGAFNLTEVDGVFQMLQSGEKVETSTTYSSWGPVLSAGGGFRFRLSHSLSLVTDINYVAWFNADGVSPVQFSPLKVGIEF